MTTTPPAALTWESAAERNRRLKLWRRAVQIAFGGQSRAIQVAWVLDGLFNTKSGYAHASNPILAKETGLSVRLVQKGLAALEADGAIVRSSFIRDSGQEQRVIYPGVSILDVGGMSVSDMGGTYL
jgi:hypothetical protein